MQGLRIVALDVENIKRLSAVHIEPGGGAVVTIAGRNAQGKTSVLDAIAYCLGGEKLMPTEPMRRGAKTGMIRVDLGDSLIVERTFTAKGSYLKVRGVEGKPLLTPQKILDELAGRLTFDPLAFARMTAKEQGALLLVLAGLDAKLNDLDAKRAEVYTERTDANREEKRLKAVYESAPRPAEGTPQEGIEVKEWTQKLDEAVEHNAMVIDVDHKILDARRTIGDLRFAIDSDNAQIESLRDQIEQLTDAVSTASAQLEEATKKEAELVDELKPLELIDLAPIRQKIEDAAEVNRQLEIRKARERAAEEWKSAREKAGEFDELIEDIDKAKAGMLKAARFPVDGLSVEDGAAMYNCLPFDQASAAEQLKVSLAIGWELNPKLKVMLVRDGSLLDDESLEIVRKSAEENNGQLWIERVKAGSGEAAIIIEDGMVQEEGA